VVLEQVEKPWSRPVPGDHADGVDIGHYGWDLVPRTTLAALISRIRRTPGLRWLRLSSGLPAYFTRERERSSAARRCGPSSAPAAAERERPGAQLMRRPYNTACTGALVERPRRRHPRSRPRDRPDRRPPRRARRGLRGDPRPRARVPYSYLHVFAYSDAGHEAARLPERVPSRAIRERSRGSGSWAAREPWRSGAA